MTQPTERRFVMEPRLDAEVEAINADKISHGTVVNSDVATGAAIDKTKIAGTAITAADTGTVTSTIIADGTIQSTDLDVLDYVKFDTTYTGGSTQPGMINWNDTDGTLEFQLKGGNVTMQIGQEQVVRVRNNTGAQLDNGKAVYISGSDGNNLRVAYANAGSETTSAGTIGVLTEDLGNGNAGYVTTFGLVRSINTSALTEGAPVWLSTTNGVLTSTRPTAPNHSVMVGFCLRAHAVNGVIFVRVDNGWELDELHNVLITSPSDGQVLAYDATAGVWKNASSSGGSLPVGGTTGQPLVKNSSTNYDASWGTLSVAGGGTGATSLTSGGYLKGAGTSAITSQTGIPAGDITSGSLSIARGGTGVTTGAGLFPIVPTSITNSSGTASFNSTTGLVTLSGCGDLMLNGIFTSAYKNYKIMFNATGSANTNFGAILAIAFCSGGVKNNTNNYTYTNMYSQSGSTGTGAGNSTGTNWIFLGYHKDFTLEITQPAVAATGTMASFIGTYNHTLMMGAGGFNANAAFDGIQFANNFYTGTMQVYGYN